MRKPIRRFRNLILCAAAAGAASVAFGQDALKLDSKAFTERLNNDDVQVLQYDSKPGAKEPMHSHRASVLYVVHGGKLHFTFPDGTSKDIEFKDGDCLWRPATTHTVENIGTTEMTAILIEMKHPTVEPAAKR
jgi:mannose-6-phosphate isomerase-like protein (cupin superfamily)